MQVTTLRPCQSGEVNFSRRCQLLIDFITFDPLVLVFFSVAMTARPLCCKFTNQNDVLTIKFCLFWDSKQLEILNLLKMTKSP